MTKIQTKKLHRRFSFLVGATIVAVVVAVLGWFYVYPIHSKHTKPDTLSTINYAPATPQEKVESNQHKEDSVNNQIQTNTNNPTKDVTPIIVDASQYGSVIEVRGFVPQITESNGTCTYTFKGTSTFTRQQAAVADATTTRCPALDLPTSLFAPGTWNTTITYISSAHTGTSESKSFEVK
jgi:hypothetical protein